MTGISPFDPNLNFMFQYCKRYEVTCDVDDLRREVENLQRFNTASGMRSHATVSGRPQKQKAQIMVLENLLETEHAIALFSAVITYPASM